MKIAVMSDIHLFCKTDKLQRALQAIDHPDILLLVGDLADRSQEDQYQLIHMLIREHLPDVPVYAVMGNHDNPARDDTHFRTFERSINAENKYIIDDSGAFYGKLCERVDVVGLNPVYHQKMFFFADKGRQLEFLEAKLKESTSTYHIVMCHPPLISYNSQRCGSMTPYIAKEQDARLQKLIDQHRNVLFISGHTHTKPTVQLDARHNNLYISNGSICPTNTGDPDNPIQQGNITILDVDHGRIHICIKGIYTLKEFYSGFFEDELEMIW